ncbi:permease [Paraliomyxa miuraensis]|uniref:permease n=1 Tax=Paraliomyxa miuraensis TaxID=376150 RepID=UPI002256F6EB|nr:permease [Paraliomyxa miuraensis]MCX4246156.1 permease [Paraliomyxa miuraensis]
MRGALIVMAAFLVVLVGIVAWRGQLPEAARASWTQAGQFGPVLVLAMLVVGCTEVLLSKELVERWLSDASGFRGIAIAWGAGFLTPGGSLVGLPIVAGLHRVGVGPSVLVTYLVSLATLSAIRIPMEVGLIGWRLATLRFLACLGLPPLAGLLTRVLLPLLRGVGV